MQDTITQLYHALHGPARNFYKIQGFRAGYNGKSNCLNLTLADSHLCQKSKDDFRTGFESGREAKIGEK